MNADFARALYRASSPPAVLGDLSSGAYPRVADNASPICTRSCSDLEIVPLLHRFLQLMTESLAIMQTVEGMFPGDRPMLPVPDSPEFEEAVR